MQLNNTHMFDPNHYHLELQFVLSQAPEISDGFFVHNLREYV